MNFLDTLRCSVGCHATPLFLLASPVAGVIEADETGIDGVAMGQGDAGTSFARADGESAVSPANRLTPVAVPASISRAAAVPSQSITTHDSAAAEFAVRPRNFVAIHAAAGGVERLLHQVSKVPGPNCEMMVLDVQSPSRIHRGLATTRAISQKCSRHWNDAQALTDDSDSHHQLAGVVRTSGGGSRRLCATSILRRFPATTGSRLQVARFSRRRQGRDNNRCHWRLS